MKILNDTYTLAPVRELRCHPRNPNQGDVGAIVASIRASGFYGALVVQRSTGYVLAGNHRLRAAIECGLEHVPVTWVECDERTATKILLADNRTAELATRDAQVLAGLLQELALEDDLGGTGYDGDDLDALLADLERGLADEEWEDAIAGLTGEPPAGRQVAFQLTLEQAQIVEDAVTQAKAGGLTRAQAIVQICEAWA